MIKNDPFCDERSVKHFVKRFFLKHIDKIENKKVVDFPAGTGETSRLLNQLGADVQSFDLFPQYFNQENLNCLKADINNGLPLDASSTDFLVCQEGIEHFHDQLFAIREFNRVIISGGYLLVTTPNHSSLASKIANLIFESESTKGIPSNEINDIWMAEDDSKNIYFGHIFLIGAQKLRTLCKISGFKLISIEKSVMSRGSLAIFTLLYPIIFIKSYLNYLRSLRKTNVDKHIAKCVFKEQFLLNINPKTLTSKNLIMLFEKEANLNELNLGLREKYKYFDQAT